VEESEDDTRFDDISDSQPPIELPAAELARWVSLLTMSYLPHLTGTLKQIR
jgi:hypothetical protein